MRGACVTYVRVTRVRVRLGAWAAAELALLEALGKPPPVDDATAFSVYQAADPESPAPVEGYVTSPRPPATFSLIAHLPPDHLQ